MAENLSLFLAARQKRLLYWIDRVKLDSLPSDVSDKANSLLKSYSIKISQAALQKDKDRSQELLRELEDIDRQLNGIFESRRLLTTELGIGALTDCSSRGGGEINS